MRSTKLLADLHREANVTPDRARRAGRRRSRRVVGAPRPVTTSTTRGVGLAHALRRETDGNPFFTGEVIRHLGETGGIVLGDDGRWTVADDLDEIGLPSSVRDVVGRRVERLGDEALRVLCLAAVIGREFDISLLARLPTSTKTRCWTSWMPRSPLRCSSRATRRTGTGSRTR